MTKPLQLRQFDPEFLANFQKGLVELLGLDGTDITRRIRWYRREM